MSKFERLLDLQPEGIPSRPAPKKLSAQAYKIPEGKLTPEQPEALVRDDAMPTAPYVATQRWREGEPHRPKDDSGTESMSLRPKPNSSEYVKLTAYIPKETHRAVKRILLESDQDLSELIEALLTQWLRSQ
jgi:hypothetical protein